MSRLPLRHDADESEITIFLSELTKHQIEALEQVVAITDQHAKEAIKLLQKCE